MKKVITVKVLGFDILIEYKSDQVRVDLSKVPVSLLHIKPSILSYLEMEGFMELQEAI